MDILPSAMIYNAIFSFDEEDDSPLNPYFDMVGLSSRNAILNLGSTFIFLLANCCLLALIGVIEFLGSDALYAWVKKHLLYGYFLRFMIQQCVTMYLASMINI